MTKLVAMTFEEASKWIASQEDRIRKLEAELNEQARVNGMGGSREAALLAKVARLEKALREIAVGLTAEDAVAGFSQRYQLCAGRLCKIARDALTAPETSAEPLCTYCVDGRCVCGSESTGSIKAPGEQG